MNKRADPSKASNWRSAYAQYDDRWRRHTARFARYVEAQIPRLMCQECGGAGGWTEPVMDDGSGPWSQCGWCEGTGYVTRWLRGAWLREQKP